MAETINTVKDVPDDYTLVTGTYERNTVLTHIGEDISDWAHGSLFVRTGEGEYTDVLFFAGNTPYLRKGVTRIV